MTVVSILFAIVGLIMAAVIFLGWLVLLLLGLTRYRRTTAGLVLDLVGGFWGLGAIALAAVGYVGVREVTRMSKVQEFRPAEYQGPVGSVALSYQGEATFTVSDLGTGKRMRATATEGKLTLPVGNYDFLSCDLEARGPDNKLWTASGSFSSPAFKHLAVTSGATPQLTLGPPFRAQVVAQAAGKDKLNLSLKLTGCDGQSYTLRGPGDQPPKFQMLSPTGEVVWQGNFAYG